MALPDHLADLERKVSARLNEALAEMRRAVEASAQRASSAMLSELDKLGPPGTGGLLAEEDLLEMTRDERSAARRTLARGLRLALVEFDGARTQGGVLEALLAGARPFGDRAALWLVRPQEILGWASLGFAGDPVAGRALPHTAAPALQRLAEGRGCVLLAGTEAAQFASVLEVEAPKLALFVPLVLRDRIAALLYLDSAAAAEIEIDALQVLVLAAAQRLELQALATRSYTPTLYLDGDAPASERGLALWDPEQFAAESAVPAAGPSETAAGAEAAAGAGERERTEALEPSTAEEEHDTLVESMPAVASGFAAFPAPSPPPSPPEPAREEIAWEMEESEEPVDMGSVSHKDLMAELEPLPQTPPTPPGPPTAPPISTTAEIPEMPPASGTPTREIPFSSPSAPGPATTEWRRVEATTAPHAIVSTVSAPVSTASTIAFVPPSPPAPAIPPIPPIDAAEDATVMIQRAEIQPAPPPLPAVPPPPEPPEEQTHPSLSGPGVPEDEPTIARSARTTEVIAPPDLQGPGWAFTSTRSPRGGGENALHEEARRLARLLVSEIKLYNEDQVEEGRHNRDIYHRLKEDIDRSRQIYEERVHESVRGTTDYFQQELIRSLAGGDPRALGV